jgi:hypothetical protein
VAVGATGVATPRPLAVSGLGAGTSAATIRPPEPEPATPSSETPRSVASLRATGVARARPVLGSGCGGGAGGASPVRSRAMGAPSAAVSPSPTRISSSTPFASAS